MKKTVFILLTLLAGAFALSSCHDESIQYDTEITGTVNLSTFSLKLDDELNKNEQKESRAMAPLEDFIVDVCSATGELKQNWKYGEMPAVFTLPIGMYKIKAHSPEVEGAQFDTPYCYGESSVFEIKKNEVTDAGEVLCRLNSIKVTVKYTKELLELLGDDAKVTVTVGEAPYEESLEYVKTETRSGFFHATVENNAVKTVFTALIEGSPMNRNEVYTDVKKGTELIITYGVKESQGDPSTGGTVTPGGITVTEDCEIVELSFNVAPDDEVIEDFGKPSVKGKDFDIAQPVIDLSKPVVVLLNAPEGMAHVYVNIQTTSTDFGGAVKTFFPSVPEKPFDLAEPDATTEANLKQFGFPYKDQIIGKQGTVEFNITGFLSALAAFPGQHTFSIEVVDAYGDKASADLVIVVESQQ